MSFQMESSLNIVLKMEVQEGKLILLISIKDEIWNEKSLKV